MSRKKPKQQAPRVPALACFGLGSELVALSASSGGSNVRTFVLDRLPSRTSWFPLYEEALGVLASGSRADGSMGDVLAVSRGLRAKLEEAVAQCVGEKEDPDDRFTLDKEWRRHVLDVLKGWRALEGVFFDRKGSLQELTMDFANYLLEIEADDRLSESHLGFFERGEALVLQAGRLRKFYELLAELCIGEYVPGSAEWKESVSNLAVYVVKENVREFRLVELLQGKVPTLVKYHQSDDAALWGGRSWPRLLASVLCFHDPSAKRHVLPALAERCAAAFQIPKHSDAALVAFQGDALQAIQLMYNHEPLSEAILGELLSRVGAIECPSVSGFGDDVFLIKPHEVDIRQLLWVNLAMSLGLGPGRVWERPVDDDNGLSCRFALEFLKKAGVEQLKHDQYRELVVDRLFAATERAARLQLGYISSTGEKAKYIASRAGLMQSKDILTSCKWAEIHPDMYPILLERAILNFLQQDYGYSLFEDFWDSEEPSEMKKTRVILNFYRAKYLIEKANDPSTALALISECVESVPLRYRRKVLRRALGLDTPIEKDMSVITTSSVNIMRLMQLVSVPALDDKRACTEDEEIRALLGLMYSEAVKRDMSSIAAT